MKFLTVLCVRNMKHLLKGDVITIWFKKTKNKTEVKVEEKSVGKY